MRRRRGRRAAVVLLAPILLPLASELGIDPAHYGTVIVATQGISVFLPPVGVSLLVACSVGGVEPAEVARPLWPLEGSDAVQSINPAPESWTPRRSRVVRQAPVTRGSQESAADPQKVVTSLRLRMSEKSLSSVTIARRSPLQIDASWKSLAPPSPWSRTVTAS